VTLLSAVPSVPLLQSLSLSCQPLCEAWLVAAALPACRQLQQLAFDICVVHAGVNLTTLFSAVVRCPRLAKLEVVDTEVDMRAACALCSDLHGTPALRHLALVRVGLDEVSAKCVRLIAQHALRVRLLITL